MQHHDKLGVAAAALVYAEPRGEGRGGQGAGVASPYSLRMPLRELLNLLPTMLNQVRAVLP